MAMIGWVWAGMEVVDDMHVGRSQSTSRVRGDIQIAHDHTAVQVRSSRYGRAGIGRSS